MLAIGVPIELMETLVCGISPAVNKKAGDAPHFLLAGLGLKQKAPPERGLMIQNAEP